MIAKKEKVLLRFNSFLLFIVLCAIPVNARSGMDTVSIDRDLQLIRLNERVYIHMSWTNHQQWGRFSSTGMIYISGDEAFLFDTPMTDDLTEKLIRFMQDSLRISVRGFIPNHWHDDCMGGINAVHRHGIKSYALELARTIAKEKGLPVPQTGFQDSLNIDFNGLPIQCMFFGAGHSTDNIVAWFPSEKILFGGCLIKDLNANHPGNYADGDLQAWPGTIEKIMKAYPEAQFVIPGHGSPGDRRLLYHTLDILRKYPLK